MRGVIVQELKDAQKEFGDGRRTQIIEDTGEIHLEDLIQVERELGYRYESADPRIEHCQWICPPCRRATMAMAQARLRSGATSLEPSTLLPMPVYANPGLGEGPLGKEDRDNYHG